MLFQKIKHQEAAPGGQTGEALHEEESENLLSFWHNKYSADGWREDCGWEGLEEEHTERREEQTRAGGGEEASQAEGARTEE